MKPLFVVGGLYSEANGVARIMRDLAAALGRSGTPVTVYGASCRGRQSIGHIFHPPTQWRSETGLWLGGLSWSPRLKRLLRKDIDEADVIHNHSIWMLPNTYSSQLAKKIGKPVVITAHGALEPWALKHSQWKKRSVGTWFQYRDLHQADCIHVNSKQELESVREFGYRGPIAIIPNGVHLCEFNNLPERSVFERILPTVKGKKIALFMARLHVKKGLENLLLAWSRIHEEFSDWHLVVAGPDCGLESRARQIVNDNQLQQTVSFVGNLQGDSRLAALSAADSFLHPSYSEGFSMGILEALACRLPVLITPGCNFPEAAKCGAAFEVPSDPEGVTLGLRNMLGATEDQRKEMGNAGFELIESRYTWDRVAEATSQLYRWISTRRNQPEFVDD